MIEQNNYIISSNERLVEARNAIEMATSIYGNIDQVLLPGTEINSHDLYRNRPKHSLDNPLDFFKDFSRAYDRAYIDAPVERELVWILERNKRSEFSKLPVRGHFVEKGIMLGSLGKLIEFNYGKYKNYSILDEKTIKEPKHLISILGEFASNHSIDYTAR